MEKNELERICCEACGIIKSVGGFLMEELGKVDVSAIETKSLNSLVSYVDKTAEEKLVAALQVILPAATFITEEETIEQASGEYRWIIDPLDGTTNFLHQLPFFAISVALQQNEKTIMGIVYEPNREECFYAWKDGGAYLNGKAIHTSNNAVLKDSLVATGFPYYDYTRQESYLKVFTHLMANTRGIRRCGAAALDLAFVACGRFDGYFEYSIQAWDVAAGAFLVQEAGGKVTDFSGGDNYLFGQEIVAVGRPLFPEFFGLIAENFTKKA